jgi:AcrR family transcriptional regulator
MPAFVSALAIELACHSRGRTLLLREFAAAGHSLSPVGPFWDLAAEAFGAPEEAELWSVLFDGALGLVALDNDRVAAATMLGRVVQRFDARLHGRPDPSVGNDDAETLLAEADAAQHRRSPPAERIISAAAALLLSGESLSHRSVAAKAGVSLAATTRDFASKAEIVLEAYRVLYRRMLETAGGDTGYGEPFMADGSLRPSYAATERLILVAARDPLLRPFALKMRNLRGRSSAEHLRETGAPNADRLDGLLWSVYHSGAQRVALGRPPQERVGAFVRLMKTARSALFAAIPPDDPIF